MDFILKDATYQESMDTVVLPYLEERREVFSLEREEGKPLHVEKYAQEGAKALVLVCHGFTENTVKYRENLYYLLKAGYSVVMPDHCGHGQSYRMVEDPSLVYVDDWKRYTSDFFFVSDWAREQFPSLPVYLYAHSMGGGLGAAMLGMRPEYFEKAVLSSPMIRPLTGPVPWKIAMSLADAKHKKGQGESYVLGQKPYAGIIPFKNSVTDSPERFYYYEKLREKEVSLQTCAPAFEWLRQCRDLTVFIHTQAAPKICCPLLIFQAGNDSLVSAKDQDQFVGEISRTHPELPTMIRIPGIKHEIFNAPYDTVRHYWELVFDFFGKDE